MSVDAVVSKGTVFNRGDGTSVEVFVKVAEVNKVGLPNSSRPMIDVTDLDSLRREFLPGLIDSGSVAVEMNFTRDTYIDMVNDQESDSSVNYQIVLPDTGDTTIDFAGYVQDLGGDVPGPDEKIGVTVTIKITGAITISS